MAVSNYNPGQELSSIDFRSMIGGPLTAVVEAQAQAALSTVGFIKSVGFEQDSEDPTTGEITPGGPVYVQFKYPKQVAPYIPAKNGIIDAVNLGGSVSDADSIVSVVITTSSGTGGNVVASVNGDNGIDLTLQSGGEGYSDDDTITVTYNSTADPSTVETAEASLSTRDEAAVPAVYDEMKLEVPLLTMVPIPFIRIDEATIDFNAKINSMEYRNVASEFKASSSFAMKNTVKGSVSAGTGGLTSLFAKGSAKSSFTNSVSFKVNASYKRTSRAGSKVEKTYQLGVNVKASQDEMPGGMEKILNILEESIVGLPANQ
ncbi:hypothetical protein PK35_15060 [Tamlana nanhaiensis]|uniref:DUF2589 domain-containing protein n=1 Tax=Neotamlana nanhaiensis TaxID=1382798 RepID=A0A0D7VXB4_9FLAO|nr:DUF2589 domain-containing protein [Tamlana nanhaiensis]KJD31424.1 hypothetical protein PK35_15060 [Tamlana nanhaiensis]